MQNTIDCNGNGLPDFPEHVKAKDVNVWMHDSGLVAAHDYSCPCCRKTSAILDLNTGIMQPCDSCQVLGYKVIKLDKRKLWKKLLFIRS